MSKLVRRAGAASKLAVFAGTAPIALTFGAVALVVACETLLLVANN